jgi:predicted transcriptional regulator
MPTAKHRIAVNLDDQEFAALAEMARKHDVSLAWLGRQALLEFVNRYGNEQLQLPLRREASTFAAHRPK